MDKIFTKKDPEIEIESAELANCLSRDSISCKPQMIFLSSKKQSNCLLYIILDETLDMQFDFFTQRKRQSENRRASRLIQKRLSARSKTFAFVNRDIKAGDDSFNFGKKAEAANLNIQESSQEINFKDGAGISSSIYFNENLQNQGPNFAEKGNSNISYLFSNDTLFDPYSYVAAF